MGGSGQDDDRRREIGGVILLALAFFLMLVLVTDPYLGQAERPMLGTQALQGPFGLPGLWMSGILSMLFGLASHGVYLITASWGITLLRHRPLDRPLTRIFGTLLTLMAAGGFIHLNTEGWAVTTGAGPGGALGAFAGEWMLLPFGVVGGNVFGVTLMVIGVLLATELLLVHLVSGIYAGIYYLVSTASHAFEELSYKRDQRRAKTSRTHRAWREKVEAILSRSPAPEELEQVDEAEDDEEEVAPAPARPAPRIRVAARMAVVEEDRHIAQEEIDFAAVEAEARDEEERLAAADAEAMEEYVALSAEPELKPLATNAQLELGAEFSNPSKPPQRRVMRRKSDPAMEPLPDDYEYPKVFKKPSTEMLDLPKNKVIQNLDEKLQQIGAHLERTLLTFNIEAHVTDVVRGPTITRFELEPATGVKVSQFNALADDIALALKAHSVRVEAPIPGKGRVGIEVPNAQRDQVLIRELLENALYKRHKGALPLALGKDITGECVVEDLAKMPHLLVAGATGAGKTVCVKSVLASLLFTKTPAELQLMLIDPKMVELSIFNDIPHLITPVVTDPKKAATALNWLINEMEERYRLFAHLRVRNIEIYNESVDNGEIEIEAHQDENENTHGPGAVELVRKLPYIVCVIDELADLMMLARADVEGAIARLAQLARAVGIHLIIATQRPSVDVLTGVIKANFPARISFQVSSRVDSRCILDEIGAERLIGMGDMLYLPAGRAKPTRVQGAFVSDDEMNTLIAYLKTQAPPQYRPEIERFGKSDAPSEDLLDESDPLFEEAVRVVLETGQASISMVQRRLRVGYTRAARLIDMMELKGIVGPHTGSKAREILVDSAPNEEVA